MKRISKALICAVLLTAIISTAMAEGETWGCLFCGEQNTGDVCEGCDERKGVWLCHSCGWYYDFNEEDIVSCLNCGATKANSLYLYGADYRDAQEYEKAYTFYSAAADAGSDSALLSMTQLLKEDGFDISNEDKIRELQRIKKLISEAEDSFASKMASYNVEHMLAKLNADSGDDEIIGIQTDSQQSASGSSEKNRKERCSWCHGTGKKDCTICGGDGWERCSTCSGRGYKSCYNCNGSGKVKRYYSGGGATGIGTGSWEYERCSSCRGRGQKDCSNCSGRGKIGCSSCGKKGYRNCVHCGGTGRVSTP